MLEDFSIATKTFRQLTIVRKERIFNKRMAMFEAFNQNWY